MGLMGLLKWVGVGLSVSLVGCFSHGSYEPARTLGAGHSSVVGTLDGTFLGGADQVLPRGTLGYRRGLSDTMDLGAGIGSDGVSVYGKFALKTRGTRISLAPQMTGMVFGSNQWSALAELPVLFGWGFGGDHELTLGARVGVWGFEFDGFFGDSGGALITTGTTLGATFGVGPGWRLVPEVGLTYPALAIRDDGTSNANDVFVVVQAGVGVGYVF
jgi:hypothetical protein